MFQPQDAKPYIVEIIRPASPEMSVADVLVGAFGLAGLFALAAVPLGLLAGYFLIRWNSRRRPEADHMPHISPSMQLDAAPRPTTDRPSDPIR